MMLKKILSIICCLGLAYSSFSSAQVYKSNKLFQKWSEWEVSYDLAKQLASSTSVTKGNGRNFSWTHMPRIRSYIDMYAVTGDVQLVDKMAQHLDVVFSFKQDTITKPTGKECYAFSLAGWADTNDVEGVEKFRYFPVHQGRILTGFLEFAKLVRKDLASANPTLWRHSADAEKYIVFAETVILSMKDLYDKKIVNNTTTAGYYYYPKQDKVDCYEVTDQKMGPYNQSLVVGTALNLLYELEGDAVKQDAYKTQIEELANGFIVDLTIPTGQDHYEWPYWPSYSGEISPKTRLPIIKAEDFAHGRLDVEFMEATYRNGLASITSKDMGRFSATMINIMDQGDDFFAFRVDGTLNDGDSETRADNLSKVDEMKRGWLLMAAYNSQILQIAERWCVSNTPHTNATLLRMGGFGMTCSGWCPGAENDMSTTFDNGNAEGWLTSEAICSAYKGKITFGGDDAKLNARKGKGYISILEVDQPHGEPGDEEFGLNSFNCDPTELNNKELSVYQDITLRHGVDEQIEIAGFVRALSKSSSSSVVSPVIALLDDNYSALNSLNVTSLNAKDSGWQPFNLEVNKGALFDPNDSSPPDVTVRALVGMRDSWKTNHSQELRADELRICTDGYCGNGSCSGGETISSCPLDCGNLTKDTSIFNASNDGWVKAGTANYDYRRSGGKLFAEEKGDNEHDTPTPETNNFELAWYKDFVADQAAFIVKGQAQVTSNYAKGSNVNHFCVLLINAGDEIARQCSEWRYSNDSGMFTFGYDFTEQVVSLTDPNVRIIVGAEDRWKSIHGQKVEIDQLVVIGGTIPINP
jgi:hypothetical protein